MNSTNPEMNFTQGGVSQAIYRMGGPDLEKECRKNYPKGIQLGEVAVTKGHRLRCKELYHITLDVKWSSMAKNVSYLYLSLSEIF